MEQNFLFFLLCLQHNKKYIYMKWKCSSFTLSLACAFTQKKQIFSLIAWKFSYISYIFHPSASFPFKSFHLQHVDTHGWWLLSLLFSSTFSYIYNLSTRAFSRLCYEKKNLYFFHPYWYFSAFLSTSFFCPCWRRQNESIFVLNHPLCLISPEVLFSSFLHFLTLRVRKREREWRRDREYVCRGKIRRMIQTSPLITLLPTSSLIQHSIVQYRKI